MGGGGGGGIGGALGKVGRIGVGVATGGLSELGGAGSIGRQLEGGISGGFDDLMGDLSGRGAADAAGQAAMAQLQAAREARDAIMKESSRYETDLMRLAAATPQELRAQEQALAYGEKQLLADEKLLASIDPNLMEASNYALSVLRGGQNSQRTPAAYQPFEAQRGEQRKQLLDSLRQQYGAGAESSSIGLKALRDFDMQSATQSAQFGMQQEQQQFGRATGLAQLFGQQRSGLDLQARAAGQIGAAGAFQNRLINARQAAGSAGLAALSGAQAPVIQSAGAPFVGAQLRAQGQTGFMNNLLNLGVTGGMAYMGGGKKG